MPGSLELLGDIGGSFQAGPQELQGHENLLRMRMMLPSIDNVFILGPVSRIVKNTLLFFTRRAPFPMLGSRVVNGYSARVSIHEFITLTTLFTVGPNISIKLLYNGCQMLHWQRKSVPNTFMPRGQVTSKLYLSSSRKRDGNFIDNFLSKLRSLLPS